MAVRCSALSLGATGENFSYMEQGDWSATLAYRWMNSDRHFVGDDEQKHRQSEESDVRNDVHTFDVTATYQAHERVSISLTVPFSHAARSSLYEHDRTNRHTMKAGGLGDVRLVANAWIVDPDTATNWNIALGLGVKFPTGGYKETDYRYRTAAQGGTQLAYVDNSIQPGDGGWGILLEAQTFYKVYDRTFLYANGTYLVQPEEMNSIGNSIWDSYIARLGVTYAVWPEQNLALSLGGRIEGVPPRDLIGGDKGARRPGYAISVEPGVTWTYKKATMNLSTPVALYRNRQNNFAGRAGDAAFADFLVLSSVTYRF